MWILWIKVEGSLGSLKTPGTSVKMINFSAFISPAIAPATVSALRFNVVPSSAIPIGEMTGMKSFSVYISSISGLIFLISPTKPKSISSISPVSSSFILWIFLQAWINLLSLPDNPAPFPSCKQIWETISVLMLPTRTIFTMLMVSSSVTLKPLMNLGSLPNFFMDLVISGPPPWTTIGCMPTYFKSTVSPAVEAIASSSTIAWPPYLIMTFLL